MRETTNIIHEPGPEIGLMSNVLDLSSNLIEDERVCKSERPKEKSGQILTGIAFECLGNGDLNVRDILATELVLLTNQLHVIVRDLLLNRYLITVTRLQYPL